jgi:hypothetical protein
MMMMMMMMIIIITWNRALLEKLTVPQQVKEFLHFMEAEGSLPC